MTSLSALADVQRKAQEIESEQAKQDLVTLMGTADEYARLISSVRVRACFPFSPLFLSFCILSVLSFFWVFELPGSEISTVADGVYLCGGGVDAVGLARL